MRLLNKMPGLLTPITLETPPQLITPVGVVKLIASNLVFPPFSYENYLFAQVRTSYVVVEFKMDPLEVTEIFTLVLPVFEPSPAVNFMIAVRVPNGTPFPFRYKLYSTVGENLVYPQYTGQKISPSSVFEIWTNNTSPTVLTQPYSLLTSITTGKQIDCDNKIPIQDNNDALEEVCEIWTTALDLPFVFNTCYGESGPPVDPPVLVADFIGDPLTGEDPLTVTFTDLSTGAVTTWSWYFGFSGGTSTLQNPIITFPAPGTYSVMLTVSAGAASDTETKVGYITVTNDIINTVSEFEALLLTVAQFETNSETIAEFEAGLPQGEIEDQS